MTKREPQTKKPRKKTPQELNKEKEIKEAKKTSIEKLYVRLGKEKTELKKHNNESNRVWKDLNQKETFLISKINKTKRLIQYKQKELGV